MNKDKIKGKMEEIKGDVKERIGGATNDPAKQAEGFIEKEKGKVRGEYGEVKDDLNRERKDPDKP